MFAFGTTAGAEETADNVKLVAADCASPMVNEIGPIA